MAKRDLERLNREVASLEEQLQALAKQYEDAMADKLTLQAEAELMERRAVAAGMSSSPSMLRISIACCG